MDSIAPISVRLGKAVLTRSGLKVGDRQADVEDLNHFSSFVLSTQALISQALSAVFPDDMGELAKSERGLRFQPGIAPWDQYVQASLSLGKATHSCEIIVGWCVLLTLVDMVTIGREVDPQAALTAAYIASKGSAAMRVDPEELRAWRAWKASKNIFAGEAEQLRHEDMKPADPFRNQVAISVPWIDQAGTFSPLDFVLTFKSDLMLDRESQVATVCIDRNYVYGPFSTDGILPLKLPLGDSSLKLSHKGADIRFRMGVYGQDKAVLRPLPRSAFQIGESQ